MHPDTFSGLRTQKDDYGRYLTTPDPTQDTANTIWGVEVLQTTQIAAGDGVLLDTTKFGRVHMRESLFVRWGYSGSDFTNNIVRYVGEERLALAVERPAAVLALSGLPVA